MGLYSFLWPADNIDTASSETIKAATKADSRPTRCVSHSGDRGSRPSAYWAFEVDSVVVSTNACSANGDLNAIFRRPSLWPCTFHSGAENQLSHCSLHDCV